MRKVLFISWEAFDSLNLPPPPPSSSSDDGSNDFFIYGWWRPGIITLPISYPEKLEKVKEGFIVIQLFEDIDTLYCMMEFFN